MADTILKERIYNANNSLKDFVLNPSPESFAFDPADEAEASAEISKITNILKFSTLSVLLSVNLLLN